MLAETPYGNDGDFTFEGLVTRYNSDLANNLGNLLARVATVVGKKCDGIGPACDPDSPLAAAAATAYADTAAGWDVVQPARALDATWQLIRATNAYLETNEPWKAEPGPDVDRVMGDALEALRIVAILVAAAIPDTAQTVWERIGLPGNVADQRLPAAATWGQYAGGTAVTKGDSLFPRLTAVMTGPRLVRHSHCHIHDERIPDGARGAVEAAREGGVATMVTVGCDRATSIAAIEVASRFDGVYATVGLHPHDASNGVDTIVDLLDTPGIVAVGEAGLDYFYEHSERDVQKVVFAAQIQLAHERDLPLVIHSRDAWDDTFDILRAEGVPTHTIFHCFTGGPEQAQACLDLGTNLSFSGIVTFKGAPDVQEAARLCPLDRMLVETDSPYLAPLPHRGKPNQPAWVAHVGQFIADLRDVPVSAVADATTANARRIFAV